MRRSQKSCEYHLKGSSSKYGRGVLHSNYSDLRRAPLFLSVSLALTLLLQAPGSAQAKGENGNFEH